MIAAAKAKKISKGNYAYKEFTIINTKRDCWVLEDGSTHKSLTAAQAYIDAAIEVAKATATVEDEIVAAAANRQREYQKARWHSRSEEQKEDYKAYRKDRWNARSEEQKQKDREYRRLRYHALKARTVEE